MKLNAQKAVSFQYELSSLMMIRQAAEKDNRGRFKYRQFFKPIVLKVKKSSIVKSDSQLKLCAKRTNLFSKNSRIDIIDLILKSLKKQQSKHGTSTKNRENLVSLILKIAVRALNVIVFLLTLLLQCK